MMEREEAIEILNRDDDSMRKGYFCINDFKAIEALKQEPQAERDCMNCDNSKDGHIDTTETCHNCMWESQFVPRRIVASDIKPDDEWMKENEWDEIYKAESEDKE